MNLKIRRNQLANRLEEFDKTLFETYLNNNQLLELALRRAKVKERIEELDFLLGDLTKDVQMIQ